MINYIWWVISNEESYLEVSHDDVKLRAVMIHEVYRALMKDHG